MVPVRALCQASCNTGGTFCKSDAGIGQASYHCRRGRLRSELASPFLGSLSERRLRNRTWKKRRRSITRRRGFKIYYDYEQSTKPLCIVVPRKVNLPPNAAEAKKSYTLPNQTNGRYKQKKHKS